MTRHSSALERIAIRSPVDALSCARLGGSVRRSRSSEHSSLAAALWRSAIERNAHGDLCFYEDSQGRQHFNFPQRIWLHTYAPMAVTPGMSLELEALAINLLTPLTRERDYRAAVGVTSKRVRSLAARFCTECLLTADTQAWVMQRSTIRAWLVSRSRIQDRSRFGPRASRSVSDWA